MENFHRCIQCIQFLKALKITIKVHIFWEGHKILQNLHLTFDWHNIGTILQNFVAFSEYIYFNTTCRYARRYNCLFIIDQCIGRNDPLDYLGVDSVLSFLGVKWSLLGEEGREHYGAEYYIPYTIMYIVYIQYNIPLVHYYYIAQVGKWMMSTAFSILFNSMTLVVECRVSILGAQN